MSETKIFEVPACAAIQHRGSNVTLRINIAAKYHCGCLAQLHAVAPNRNREHDIHGFMTTLGRFVDRKEALQLMLAAGRTSANKEAHHDGWSLNGELASEDLY